MGLFNNFATDKTLEKGGIAYTPDSTTLITLARAGGANVKFSKIIEAKTKPHRRQIDNGTMDPVLDRQIMIAAYSETVVKNWETIVGEGEDATAVQGIEANPETPDVYDCPIDANGLVGFTKHNVVATLTALPDLFADMMQQSQKMANYQVLDREDDAKN